MIEKYEFIKLERNRGIVFSVWLNKHTGKEENVIIGELLNPD